ncbi:hypothetical protein C1645_880239 [Glomus cerebriforme]|uniref:Uncharacterized protein n=1 Tax=Glomus cerebriforme TaxID=658196 RepID=A0A397SIA2_9GLOM|nr:hypothetical protein C1645_880239 [Glomus cerebriforme]
MIVIENNDNNNKTSLSFWSDTEKWKLFSELFSLDWEGKIVLCTFSLTLESEMVLLAFRLVCEIGKW